MDFDLLREGDGDLVDMAFSKKRVEDRKTWLRSLEPGAFVDYGVDALAYKDFVHKELSLFSVADNQRSIPCVVDGLKPSQRKVLFACFKRKLRREIKVAQLAGYVSEHSAYHHGEASLTGTIVGMAQDFVWSCVEIISGAPRHRRDIYNLTHWLIFTQLSTSTSMYGSPVAFPKARNGALSGSRGSNQCL